MPTTRNKRSQSNASTPKPTKMPKLDVLTSIEHFLQYSKQKYESSELQGEFNADFLHSAFESYRQEITGQSRYQCSSLDTEKLRDLGVVEISTGIKTDTNTLQSFAKHTFSDKIRKEALKKMLTMLIPTVTHFSRATEFGCRAIVNVFILTAVTIHEQEIKSDPNKKHTYILVHPEVSLTPKDEDNGPINSPDTIPSLSGITDYLIAEHLNKRENLGAHYNWTLEQLLVMEAGRVIPSCLVIEAKIGQTRGERITHGIHEAVGQALLFAKMQKVDVVRFIVTDGEQWVQGVLRRREGANGESWGFHKRVGHPTVLENLADYFEEWDDARLANLVEEVASELASQENIEDPPELTKEMRAIYGLGACIGELLEWAWPEHGDRLFTFSGEGQLYHTVPHISPALEN